MSFSNFSMKQKDDILETQSNEKLNSEAENSLAQSEKFDYGKTAEVLEDINVAKLNVDPEILASTVKILFDSPVNDQVLNHYFYNLSVNTICLARVLVFLQIVNEQDVAMGDLFLEEAEQQKFSDLEVQELMAVDALMNIYVFDSTPKKVVLSIYFFKKTPLQ